MILTDEPGALNPELLDSLVALQASLRQAAHDGTAAHQAEHDTWKRVLALGRQALGYFLALPGDGDQGPTLTSPDGSHVERLPQTHPRRYASVFGEFALSGAAYGSREGQKIDFAPLDNRLALPEGASSYLLQGWGQALCCEQAFGQAQTTLGRVLGLSQSVDSLERVSQRMAQAATPFRLNQPVPPPAEGGEPLVAQGDGKGAVMRRGADEPSPKAHPGKGEKASRKRVATAGAVYSVDRHARTPGQVVASLSRDNGEPPPERPRPCHKRVWASLPSAAKPRGSGQAAVYLWLLRELVRPNPKQHRETVHLHDGQGGLWGACRETLP